jgi:outer membrane protein OmpA-like peptidoglycan-associated protein
MKKFASIAVISLLTTAACQGQGGYNDNRQTYQGAGLGAIVGAATGALTGKGSTDRRQRALAGAGIGAVAGGGYGAYMDNQEAEFRRSLSGKGVQIQRVGDELVLTMPDNITFDTGSSALKPNFVYENVNNQTTQPSPACPNALLIFLQELEIQFFPLTMTR